jgi:hypothetical protein
MRSIFLLIALISMAGCSQSNYAKYGPIYEQVVLSEVPDYSNLNYWAAHPNKKNPSDSIPKGILEDKAVPQKAVDVFFVYPTSYLDKTMPQG